MLLTENTSTYDEAKLTYVNHNIIPNLEISTLVDNTRNSLEINSKKVDSKKQETNSNNKIKENEKVCRIIKLYGLFCYIRYVDHGGW